MIPLKVYETLDTLYSGKQWVFNGNDLSGLVWKDTNTHFDEALFLETYKKLVLNDVRKERDNLLDKTDKYVTIDYPHPTPEAKQAWLDYRQALRDLPANTMDPENPAWPESPK